MRIAFALLIGAHGLIHLIGAAKAFKWAEVTALSNAISPLCGALWAIAAVLLVSTAIGFALEYEWWWYLGLPGLILSQILIAQQWSDARFGTIVNVLLLVPVMLSALDARPSSFRSRFARDRDALLARQAGPPQIVVDSELSVLPTLMQAYLRRVGAVGRPHIRNMRVCFDAKMRSSSAAPWMLSSASQYEFFDSPARLFHMRATRGGVPIDVFHRYVDNAATFQVKIAGVWPMVNKGGPVLTRAETVTLMNDIVVMAPAAVLDLPFTWTTTGKHTLAAKFTNAGHTVSAEITFDDAGDLVGFFSRDRPQDVDLGDRNVPWSTPISGYREVDGIRVGAMGDANWVDSSGEWTYGRFVIRSIAYNVER